MIWGGRSAAAIAAGIPLVLAVSACSVVEGLKPPPLATAFQPQPPPAPPPLPAAPEPPAIAGPQGARAEMVNFLSAKGYRDFQIDALVRHAKIESGLNACITGPGGFRYLFQWGGRRLAQLQRFANSSGCPDIRKQLAFADQELRGEAKFACFWNATTEAGAFAALRRGFGRGSC